MAEVVADLQRIRRRRNQCSCAIAPSTTQRYTPRPEPCRWLCGVRRALDLTDAGPYGEIACYLSVHRGAEHDAYRTLSFAEGVSFARRAQAPAHFGVGLRDTVCPPSGAYAAYDHCGELAGRALRKEIHAYPFQRARGG